MIKRHPLKNLHFFEFGLNSFKNSLSKHIELFNKNPQNIGSLFQNSIDAINQAIVLEKSKDEIMRLLSVANQLGIANFISVADLAFDYNISYKGKEYSFKREKSATYSDFIRWQKAYYLSVILRDKEGIDILRSVPVQQLKEANLKGDDFDYRMVEFLKGLYDDEANIGELLVQAMEASNPDLLPKERHKYVLNIKILELSLYRCIFTSAEEEFNKKLELALKNHKMFWGTKENVFAPEGWTSLPLIAVSIIGQGSRDFSIDITSDYIPSWLISNESKLRTI